MFDQATVNALSDIVERATMEWVKAATADDLKAAFGPSLA